MKKGETSERSGRKVGAVLGIGNEEMKERGSRGKKRAEGVKESEGGRLLRGEEKVKWGGK